MFRRIVIEEWQNVLTIVSFMLFFSSFGIAMLRVFSISKKNVERIQNLPLEPENHGNE